MSSSHEAESRPDSPESPETKAKVFLDIWSYDLSFTWPGPKTRRDPLKIWEGLITDDREVLIGRLVRELESVTRRAKNLMLSSNLSIYAQEYLNYVFIRSLYTIPSLILPKQVLGFDEEHPFGFFESGIQSRLVEYRLYLLSRHIRGEAPAEYDQHEWWDKWQGNLREQHSKAGADPTEETLLTAAIAGQYHPDLLPPIEDIIQPPIKVKFYKLGGTWDMIEKDSRFIGTGNLDDAELARLEESLGIYGSLHPNRLANAERRLARLVYQKMKDTKAEQFGADEHFASWSPDFGKSVTGPFIALYSGDSSHLRSSLVAPIVSVLLEEAIKDPETPIIGAQGTDTADTAILSILDALVFDTKLPAFIFTGANRSHREEDSDAPANFSDLASLTNFDIRNINLLPAGEYNYKQPPVTSGVFWVFHDNIYPVADLNKLDPAETREIEGTSTFFSPHMLVVNKRSFTDVKTFWSKFLRTNWRHGTCEAPPAEHVSRRSSMKELFDALNSVQTISLDDQNRVWQEVAALRDANVKAVIIAAHGLGNVNNVIRKAAVEAAKEGKIVIDVSRSLIGEVNTRYAGSLLDANSAELAGTDTSILSSNKLNKTAARAVAVRALLEGLGQQQTQDLIDRYCQARKLL